MRVYSAHEEENLRAQRALRDWAATGRITREQLQELEQEVNPGLQRTSAWLRATIFFFTLVCGVALCGILFLTRILRDPSAPTWFLLSGACYGLAEYVISRNVRKLYRHGVEEALIIGMLLFFSLGVFSLLHPSGLFGRGWADAWAALIVGIACGVVYGRYGFMYAAVGSMACLACVPVILVTSAPAALRFSIAAMFAAFCGGIGFLRSLHRDGYRDEEYAFLQAVCVVALYLSLNLQLTSLGFWRIGGILPGPVNLAEYPRWFYWFTYISIWLIPGATFLWAVRERDRPLLSVGILLMILTLVSNKPYLGWTRHEWDPMLLGGLLIFAAVQIRRWLASGPGGSRAGFTAERLSASDKKLLAGLGNLSFALNPGGMSAHPVPEKPGFGGGRSGGGGAGGGW